MGQSALSQSLSSLHNCFGRPTELKRWRLLAQLWGCARGQDCPSCRGWNSSCRECQMARKEALPGYVGSPDRQTEGFLVTLLSIFFAHLNSPLLPPFLCLFFFFKAIYCLFLWFWGLNPGASHMPAKFSTTYLHPQPYWHSAQPFPMSLSGVWYLSPATLGLPSPSFRNSGHIFPWCSYTPQFPWALACVGLTVFLPTCKISRSIHSHPGLLFPPVLFKDACTQAFHSWGQWTLVVRTTQWLVSCGPEIHLRA